MTPRNLQTAGGLAFRRRRAFTLVELLVVIAIIGVLVGLILPAVQSARATSRRLSCKNNLKNLGLAMHEFEDAFGYLPPARVLGPFSQLKIKNPVEHSWAVFLLPYLEQQPLRDRYSLEHDFRDPVNAEVVMTRLPVMLCLAAPKRVHDTFTSGGFQDWKTFPSDYVPIMRVDPSLAVAGLADVVDDYRGVLGSNQLNRLADIKDGLSNTLLLTECAGRPDHWTAAKGGSTLRVRGSGWADSRGAFSMHGSTPDGLTRLGPCAINCTNDREIYAFHSAGTNAVFADGSVRFLLRRLGTREVARMITMRGREGGDASE